MAESPLLRFGRLLAGVALMRGRLGHQVLGQLLVAGTSEPAIAGAAVVIAATSRQKNAVANVAIRTAAPVVAVHLLLREEVKRIERREAAVSKREQDVRSKEIVTALVRTPSRTPRRARRRSGGSR